MLDDNDYYDYDDDYVEYDDDDAGCTDVDNWNSNVAAVVVDVDDSEVIRVMLSRLTGWTGLK
ncbi:Uncharacterized protein BM_BM11102 [Brugia malayi]|uniref:Bm11102 n=1 Tax=Brugia malayi TaxID=6279 RepID=A0A4E9F2D7_BRUMA|nr:Uncharacterized protein BM_BM11102 [Brugia malayi]VIO90857.1 Uncharacterized protein BM_BM11102 [Brugia malayi]